jgi:hypothetical protein
MFEFIIDPFGIIHEVLDTDSEVVPLCSWSGSDAWPAEFTLQQSDVEKRSTCVHCLHVSIDFLLKEVQDLRNDVAFLEGGGVA